MNMHGRSFSHNIKLAHLENKHPSDLYISNPDNCIKDSANDDAWKLKRSKKNAESKKKLETILSIYKNGGRNELESEIYHQPDKAKAEVEAFINVQSLSKKNDLQEKEQKHLKSNLNVGIIPSPKDIIKETNSIFLPFPDLGRKINSPRSPYLHHDSPQNGALIEPCIPGINRTDSTGFLSYVSNTHNKEAKPETKPLKTSNSPSPSPVNKAKKFKHTSFSFRDYDLKYFKPMRSNFAVKVPPTIQEIQDNKAKIASSDGNFSEKQKVLSKWKINPNKLILSSLVTPDIIPISPRKKKTVTEIFNNLNHKYSMGSLGLKDVDKDSINFNLEKLVLTPQ